MNDLAILKREMLRIRDNFGDIPEYQALKRELGLVTYIREHLSAPIVHEIEILNAFRQYWCGQIYCSEDLAEKCGFADKESFADTFRLFLEWEVAW